MSAATSRASLTGWRRWGAYLALTLVFAVACGLLSWWQWARRGEAVDEIQRIEQNYDAAPRAVDEVLDGFSAWDDDDEWTPVALHGEYLADQQVLVRNRVRGGQPGFEQLVPLRLDDGSVFVVDRGWLPLGDGPNATPDAVPQPPEGEVTVVARLRQAEPALPGRSAPEGQLPRSTSRRSSVGSRMRATRVPMACSRARTRRWTTCRSRPRDRRRTKARTCRTRCSGSRSGCSPSSACSGRGDANAESPRSPR
ncbi:SURF1 family protein [Homoserinibacter gongjuensis]|uniref:SURF1-like protein n=1 Tax=Homoserinibacter gongjuensis TaxID=1162968 RepID=A0ABQ6JWD9_9MICO|nr:SURF1 family cytochrome oxidase biogenesis protein [Homoserinibacter gongjuensis]GMA92606.1 hypothetical protein GCM10025869_31350 [Homoserinibacter gongjuensis]